MAPHTIDIAFVGLIARLFGAVAPGAAGRGWAVAVRLSFPCLIYIVEMALCTGFSCAMFKASHCQRFIFEMTFTAVIGKFGVIRAGCQVTAIGSRPAAAACGYDHYKKTREWWYKVHDDFRLF